MVWRVFFVAFGQPMSGRPANGMSTGCWLGFSMVQLKLWLKFVFQTFSLPTKEEAGSHGTALHFSTYLSSQVSSLGSFPTGMDGSGFNSLHL